MKEAEEEVGSSHEDQGLMVVEEVLVCVSDSFGEVFTVYFFLFVCEDVDGICLKKEIISQNQIRYEKIRRKKRIKITTQK